jgi:hypothetical protein
VLRPGLKPFTPYLLGLFFVLALASGSPGELVRPQDFVLPVLGSFLVAGLAHALGWLLTRDTTKATLIASVWIIAFSTLGIAVDQGGFAASLGPSPGEVVCLALYVIVAVALSVALAGTGRSLDGLLGFLALMAALLVGYNGLLMVPWRTPASAAPQLPRSAILAPAASGRDPDVLVVVLDKYTGSQTLREQYEYDNQPFVDFLRNRGFAVPSAARANYVNTFLALDAMLNMEYLDSVAARTGIRNRNRDLYYARIEGNRLASFFRERGYEFVFLPTAYGATRRNRYADRQIPDPAEIRPELVTSWYRTTPLPGLQRLGCALQGCPYPMAYTPETAATFDYKFEQLAELAGQQRPTFVLAHFLLPHEPYVYRSDCSHRTPYWPSRDNGPDSAKVTKAYIEQISCLNRKLETVITSWQARSIVPPIIVLQGDHGHGRTGRHLPELAALRPAQVADRTSVFAAYLVPGVSGGVPTGVTPINGMRFMLREGFGADLPPVTDQTYWSAFDTPNALKPLP